MDGANNSTTFTDNSSLALPVSVFGDAKISTSQSKFGGSSGLFDGNGDYLQATSSGFTFGTDDFTVEGWMYLVNGVEYKAIASFNSADDNNTLYVNGITLVWWDNNAIRAQSAAFP